MKTAAELFPTYAEEEKKDGSFYGPGDYQPILNEFGEILLQVDDEGYQGDTRVLYLSNGKYGWLQFGWGSCSGCDALQASNHISEIQVLMDELFKSIKWFDSKEEALKFFQEHDWEGDYSWNRKEQKQFVKKCIHYFLSETK